MTNICTYLNKLQRNLENWYILSYKAYKNTSHGEIIPEHYSHLKDYIKDDLSFDYELFYYDLYDIFDNILCEMINSIESICGEIKFIQCSEKDSQLYVTVNSEYKLIFVCDEPYDLDYIDVTLKS